jgi:hypothetical protein
MGGVVENADTPAHPRLARILGLGGSDDGRVLRSGWPTALPRRSAPTTFLSGCNMAFRTAVVREHRFDAARFGRYGLGEDLEFTHRLARAGHRLVIDDRARCWHHSAKPRADERWGRAEVVLPLLVLGADLSIPRWSLAAAALTLAHVGQPERFRGNLSGIAAVLARRAADVVDLEKGEPRPRRSPGVQ